MTVEGRIVFGADKLDALGAIGIAREFAMGARCQEASYDPSVPVPTFSSAEEYKAA